MKEVEQEQFYNFFQISSDIMLMVDDNSNLLKVNPATLNILGYSEEELFSSPIQSFVHPDDRKATENSLNLIDQRGIYKNFENRWRCKDGSYLWFSWCMAHDSENKLNYYTARDITEQKRTKEEFQKQENVYRVLAENSMDVIIQYDRNHRYTYVNPAISQFLAYSHEDLLGKTHQELGFPEDLCKLWNDSIEDVFTTGKSQSEFFEVESNNGMLLIHWRVFPELSPAGAVKSVFSVSRDITQYQQSEEEQQKNRQLSSLGVLAGGIAHDFNNILTVLFGNISLAKSQIPQDSPGQVTLGKAEKAFYRATYLTSQLLTFAKGGDPVKQNISIGGLIKEVSLFDLSGSNVKLVFKPAEKLWLASVDKGQMAQVFSNLTINANQSMPDGGHLYISIENCHIDKDDMPGLNPGRYLKFSVRDEGIGIHPAQLKRIFDPYYSTKHTGSGLGLATVYSIINKHGGHISANSTPGVGSCFTLYLPASDSIQIDTEEHSLVAETNTEETARILIMDDDAMILNLASAMLTRNNYIVETAADGLQTVEKYQQSMSEGNPYHCIIMDLTIPGGMGGAETIKKILALDPDAKAIVSSGYAVDPIMANYQDYGFKGVITKPFTIHSLNDEVHKILNQ